MIPTLTDNSTSCADGGEVQPTDTVPEQKCLEDGIKAGTEENSSQPLTTQDLHLDTPIQKQERVTQAPDDIGITTSTHKEKKSAGETPKGEPIGNTTTDQASGTEDATPKRAEITRLEKLAQSQNEINDLILSVVKPDINTPHNLPKDNEGMALAIVADTPYHDLPVDKKPPPATDTEQLELDTTEPNMMQKTNEVANNSARHETVADSVQTLENTRGNKDE